MKYTQIPSDTFEKIQMNAGILCKNFTPSTGEVSGLIGATTGGIQFQDNISFQDFGDDIDNCPKNTKELKKVENREITTAGSFVTVDEASAIKTIGVADGDGNGHITPRDDVLAKDFEDIWFIGDYSDVNTGENAGYLAIHMMNTLSTGGFQMQTADKGKGTFAFTLTAHYSIEAQSVVPYEIYMRQGEAEVKPSILFDTHIITLSVGQTKTLTATTVPADAEITWTSGSELVAEVTDGAVEGIGAGNTIITGTITVDGIDYTDTCTAIVSAE